MNKKFSFILIYVVFFLLGDILFSNFVYKKDLNHNCYEYTKNFFHLKKNCHAKEKWIRNVKSYDVYTDENGFRFSGIKNQKLNKNEAFVFFGDSFTYGMGLEYKNTFVGLIENARKDNKIYNLGVPGYSPSVFNYQLKKIITDKIIPSKIFYVLDISDVSEEASQWDIDANYDHPIQINKTNNEKAKDNNDFKNFTKANLKGSRLIARSINNFFRSLRLNYFRSDNEIRKPGHSGWGDFLYKNLKDTNQQLWEPYGFEKGLSKISIKLKEVSVLAESINADIYIIIYPWPDSLEYGQNNFNWENFTENLCNDISCKKLINFFPDFRKVKRNYKDWLTKLYINGDLHITAYGHKIIAEKILKEVF